MYYFGGKQQRSAEEDFHNNRDVDPFANDLRAVRDYASRIRLDNLIQHPREEPPRADTWYTLLGPKRDVDFNYTYHKQANMQPGITEYIRNVTNYANFKYNLNEALEPKPPGKKEEVRDFFDLDQAFVDTFTPEWGILTVMNWNMTRDDYYLDVYIHNGQYLNELDFITHLSPLPGDPPNFVHYQLTNQSPNYDYAEVLLTRFNVQWNEWDTAMQRDKQGDYMRIDPDDFSGHFRRLQYMLLSYYLDDRDDCYTPRPLPGVRALAEDQPWYDDTIHPHVNYNIKTYGRGMDSYMQVHELRMEPDGHFSYPETIIVHSDD